MISKVKAIFRNRKNKNVIKTFTNIDHSSFIDNPDFLDLRNPKPGKTYLSIGKECIINGKFIFESTEGFIKIGDRVHIGNSTIICRSSVELGNDIYIAWGTTLYDHDSHSIDFLERIKDRKREFAERKEGDLNSIKTKDWSVVNSKPITIKDHAWIGMNCIILKGVTIGEGAIIGAGSVVTNDIPAFTVATGNPARVVREIKF